MNSPPRRSILCPNCRKLISRDEAHCPYCGIADPGSWWRNNPLTRGFKNADQIVKVIISVNLGLYLVSILIDPSSSSLRLNPFSFLSPSNRGLFLLGATGTIPINQFDRWWTLLSANYLHGGILHIFFNMFAFRQLAPFVIREFGTHRMFSIYTLGGIIGFFVSYMAGVRFTIGASAAICSLIGTALYYGKSRGGAYGQAIYKQISGWALGIFLFGLLVPGINNWGHGGGIVAGVILGALLGYHERRREGMFHKMLSGSCMALTLVILGWAVFSGIMLRLSGQ